VAGRASAFSDPEIIRLASESFVPVTGDDWYQRRRKDMVGEFFRGVARQGPRGGTEDGTNQGIYFFTASGKLLAYKNAGQNADVMREVFHEALERWNRLPADERKAGAVDVPDIAPSDLDPRYTRGLPEGGLVVSVFTRALQRDKEGRLETCSGDTTGGLRGFQTAYDHLWLAGEEWRSLLPREPQVGDSLPLPDEIAARIARFHLTDNTRGEPNMWQSHEVLRREMTLTVSEVTDQRVQLKLVGSVLLATERDTEKAKRGYDAALLGTIAFDRSTGAVVRFDVAALGDAWGSGTYTRGARPGRNPLAVVFELAAGDRPADKVPPQAMREPTRYFSAAR
jgi:hypothetical protein